jgi:hypothetical protein
MGARPHTKKRGVSPAIIAVALVIAGITIVAAIAIPAHLDRLQHAKTAEARDNLRSLFMGAAAYYSREHVASDGTVLTGCTVTPASTPNVPGPDETTPGALSPSFEALGFAPAGPIYYRYEIVSVPGCGHPSGETLYSFRAHGDLDGDGVHSLFELCAGPGSRGELVRSPVPYVERELE